MATEGKVLTERAHTGKSMSCNKKQQINRDHKLDYIVSGIIK